MAFDEWIRFSQLPTSISGQPSLYEIRCGSIKLKIGIAGDLFRRLDQHRKSLQKRLRGVESDNPQQSAVQSKGSILAKHLYFDRSITNEFDLTQETGRTKFLEEKCRVSWLITASREAARELEITYEKSGDYRYVGTVIVR